MSFDYSILSPSEREEEFGFVLGEVVQIRRSNGHWVHGRIRDFNIAENERPSAVVHYKVGQEVRKKRIPLVSTSIKKTDFFAEELKLDSPNFEDGRIPAPISIKSSQMALEELRKEIKCPICFDLPINGVVLMCGHLFCKKCILSSLEQSNKCPCCRKTLNRTALRCWPLLQAIEILKSTPQDDGEFTSSQPRRMRLSL